MSDFLHGVETITSSTVSLVNTVKTAVIGIIGTADGGSANVLKLLTSETDDSYFGTTGTIPEALGIIRTITKKYGATIFAVSVGKSTDTITDAEIEGSYDSATGTRTGLTLFDACYPIYGFRPKILIAPRFSSLAVKSALATYASSYRGFAYVDAPADTKYSAALALRGTDGIWAASHYRTKLLYPYVYDNDSVAHPFSIYAAANRIVIDSTNILSGGGWWVSSSNHAIDGISGLVYPLTASINDSTCEVNMLNAAGITTVYNNQGSDFREWGNRSSAYPSNTDVLTFECSQRARDIIDESIELAMMPYIDKPIIQAFIDNVLLTVNSYLNTLIGKGACLEGSKCIYEAAKNSAEELAKGHIVFTTDYLTPTPAERITFDSYVDTSLLTSLLS